jgi:23S rRNA (guanine745-N1)-methyltransferase
VCLAGDTIEERVETSYLSCTVRGCGKPLERRGRAFVCPAGHAFDVARSGYVNLLQPQDRRSLAAGDARAIVEARAALLEAGVGRTALDAMVRHAAGLALGDDPLVVDLGSGSGDLLARVAGARRIRGVGIDLSAAAAAHASRRYPHLTWVVANADRRLPLQDGRADLILSLHARRNPAECARVLAPAGRLLVAVPAADDLIELRTRLGGERVERERADAVAAAHDPWFTVERIPPAREHHHVVGQPLRDLLRTTYRGARRSAAARLAGAEALDVTLASDLLLFSKRSGA